MALATAIAAGRGCGSAIRVASGEGGGADAVGTAGTGGGTTHADGDTGHPPVEDDGESETCGFIACDDDIPVDNSCDPGVQDCPEGEKCTGYVMTPGYCCVDATKCVPIIGDRKFGDPCERGVDNDDCAEGLFCMAQTSGDVGPGVCLTLCDVNSPTSCADKGLPEASCIGYSQAIMPLCQDECDPLAQDCVDPSGCYGAGNEGFFCVLPDHEPGTGNDGDQCGAIQGCEPGLTCVAGDIKADCAGLERCCTPFCDCSDPDAPECTSEAEDCICYFEEGHAPPGYEKIGLCALP